MTPAEKKLDPTLQDRPLDKTGTKQPVGTVKYVKFRDAKKGDSIRKAWYTPARDDLAGIGLAGPVDQ